MLAVNCCQLLFTFSKLCSQLILVEELVAVCSDWWVNSMKGCSYEDTDPQHAVHLHMLVGVGLNIP